jgi:hypothetical protein
LKTKKAPGFDRVRNEMLKNGINYLMSSLVELFNFIFKKRTFPKNWSIGMITPIFKSGNKSDPSNYRGICVTSYLGKLFCLFGNRSVRFGNCSEIARRLNSNGQRPAVEKKIL